MFVHLQQTIARKQCLENCLKSIKIQIFTLDKGEPDPEDTKIAGLDRTIFIVIIVAVVLILVIIIAVCIRKRRAREGNVTLNKYRPSSKTNPEAVGLHQPDNNDEEEIDLEVLPSEKVCTKEEIKLQP